MDMVAPAQVSEPADFTSFATLLVETAGSVSFVAAIVPADEKAVSVGAVVSSNVRNAVVGTVTVTVSELDEVACAKELPSAAFVAVTEHVATLAGAVSPAALTVQPPAVTWYVTAPAPLPPVVLRFVVPPALRLVDAAATLNAACGARTVTVKGDEVIAE